MQTIPYTQVQVNLAEIIGEIISTNERIKVAGETSSQKDRMIYTIYEDGS